MQVMSIGVGKVGTNMYRQTMTMTHPMNILQFSYSLSSQYLYNTEIEGTYSSSIS